MIVSCIINCNIDLNPKTKKITFLIFFNVLLWRWKEGNVSLGVKLSSMSEDKGEKFYRVNKYSNNRSNIPKYEHEIWSKGSVYKTWAEIILFQLFSMIKCAAYAIISRFWEINTLKSQLYWGSFFRCDRFDCATTDEPYEISQNNFLHSTGN